jgi:hypothetical protein
MNRLALEQFILKYHLNGLLETIVWQASDTALKTLGASDDRQLMVSIETSGLRLPTNEYIVKDTSQLRSMLGLFGDSVTIKIANSNRGTPNAFEISDKQVKARFTLADALAKPPIPSLVNLPAPTLVLQLDAQMVQTLVKSKSVLPDVVDVALVELEGTAKLIVGYEPRRNTTQIAIDPTVISGAAPTEPTYFNIEHLRQILVANKEAKSILWNITPPKFSHLKFEIDGYDANYYLLASK